MNNDARQIRLSDRAKGSRLLLIVILAAVLCGSGWSGTAAADNTQTEQKQATITTEPASEPGFAQSRQDSPSLAIAAAKALGALAVVLGLLLLLAAALKKLGLTGQNPRGDGLIKVLETRMIAPKKYVAILDIAGQAMAVGISEQQITLLTKLEPNEQIQALARQRPTSPRFASLLAKAITKSNSTSKEDHA